jgi:hypothetical protein
MEMFHLSMQGMIAYIMRQGRSISSVFQHSYRFFCNQEYIIHNTVTSLIQFSLGSLPTMSSFTQKLGSGWEGINENEYFNTDELQKEVEIVTSEGYGLHPTDENEIDQSCSNKVQWRVVFYSVRYRTI